jgi:hypothetical protein
MSLMDFLQMMTRITFAERLPDGNEKPGDAV